MDDDALGLIVSDELNPAKARVLLMLALMDDRSIGEIQKLYYTY